MDIPKDVYEILRKVSKIENMVMPTFSFHERNKKGVGYNGEVYFVTIQDKQRNMKKLQVVVKKASEIDTVRNNVPVAKMYSNECEFYNKLWPILTNFQQAINRPPIVAEIPKCYDTYLLKSKEKLVLENLKFRNFETVNTSVFLNEEHFELIFRRYGKFHGLSFAYKDKFPKTFKELTDELFDFWGGLQEMPVINRSVSLTLQESADYLAQESEEKILEKYLKYVANGSEELSNSTKYTGPHSVLLHGDSFSNNLMFKYNEARVPIDLRFIDFQLITTGSPVLDLSYCFYSGATKEILKDLDYYLTIYHDSLSDTLTKFECDPTKIFTRKMLNEEWKTNCKFGFIMGLLLLKTKCTREDQHMDMLELLENPDPKVAQAGKLNEMEVKERTLDLLRHMYENNFF